MNQHAFTVGGYKVPVTLACPWTLGNIIQFTSFLRGLCLLASIWLDRVNPGHALSDSFLAVFFLPLSGKDCGLGRNVKVDPKVRSLETSACLRGKVSHVASVSPSTKWGLHSLSQPQGGWADPQEDLSTFDEIYKCISFIMIKPWLTRFSFLHFF